MANCESLNDIDNLNCPSIMIDMDGVIADFCGGVVTWYNRLYSMRTKIAYDDIVDYGFSSVMSEYDLERIMSMPSFFDTLLPIDGAVDGINYLCDIGCELMFVTKLPRYNAYKASNSFVVPESADNKISWFLREIVDKVDGLSYKNLALVFSKGWLSNRFDIAFEDHVENLIDFNATRVLFDAPYNKRFMNGTIVNDHVYSIRRVGVNNRLNAWPEFITVVDNFISNRNRCNING